MYQLLDGTVAVWFADLSLMNMSLTSNVTDKIHAFSLCLLFEQVALFSS